VKRTGIPCVIVDMSTTVISPRPENPVPLAFPANQPAEIGPLADSLMQALGPLVTVPDRSAVLQSLEGIAFTDVASIGLEITLPPHEPACDLSLLLAPGLVPAFAKNPALHRLANEIAERESGSTWWELDSSKGSGTGGFVRMLEGVDGHAACMAAIGADDPDLAVAMERLNSIVKQFPGGCHMLGFFPDRTPSAAAGLLTLHGETLSKVIEVITAEAGPIAHVDPKDPRIHAMTEAFGGMGIAVGCDSLGRIGVAAEFAFADRVPAMIERRWDDALANLDLGAANGAVPYLLATQTIHDFRDLFPLTVLSGIDHLKITPDGRLKAYVGALPFQRGVGINGLPPGIP
jgi:hypothetical protein